MSNCLYRHFNSAGRLLYVGISCRVLSRTREHIKSAKWSDEIARIDIEHYSSREAVVAAEKSAIIAERPLFNIVHNKHVRGQKAPSRELVEKPVAVIKPNRKQSFSIKRADHALDCCNIDELDELDDDSQLAYVWCLTHQKYESHYIPLDYIRDGGVFVKRGHSQC